MNETKPSAPPVRFQASKDAPTLLRITFATGAVFEIPTAQSYEASHTTARYLFSLFSRGDIAEIVKTLRQYKPEAETLAKIEALLWALQG